MTIQENSICNSITVPAISKKHLTTEIHNGQNSNNGEPIANVHSHNINSTTSSFKECRDTQQTSVVARLRPCMPCLWKPSTLSPSTTAPHQ